MLDLFDRRVSIFRIIQWVVLEVREAGGEVSQQVLQSFVLAELEARFLFGNDVRKLLAELRYEIAYLHMYTTAMANDFSRPDRGEILITRLAIMLKFNWNEKQSEKDFDITRGSEWLSRLARVFAPYMRLAQKQRSMWWPF